MIQYFLQLQANYLYNYPKDLLKERIDSNMYRFQDKKANQY